MLKKILMVIGGIFVLLVVIGIVAGGDDKATSTQPTQPQQVATTATEAPKANEEKTEDTKSNLTSSQKNALRKAEQYLEFKGFSRDGLIYQLSSDVEGFSKADATVAVDNLTVDWNEQAARMAKSYLEMQGYSCKGLVQQLSSDAGEKFTKSQAEYGAKTAGACN